MPGDVAPGLLGLRATARLGVVLAALVLLAVGRLLAATNEEIVALTDNFADGNIHTGPAWVAVPMLNWYNPYYVETLDGKPWATARGYGAMGSDFTLPPDRVWPVALDPARGPMRLALTLRFRPGAAKNPLDMSVLGFQSDGRWGARFNPAGAVEFGITPMSGRGGVAFHCPVPQMLDGKPVRFEFVLGGEAGFVLRRDGKEVFTMEAGKREELRRELRTYRCLAFLGSQAVTTDNPYFMTPSFKDAQGDFWISDIEVRGVPEQIEMPQGLSLHAVPRALLALRGVGGFDTTLFADLAAAGWSVKQVLDRTGPSPFQSHLALTNLLAFQCVALADIPAPRLGLEACTTLKEYVRLGGCVLVCGGVNTLNRGRYFTSPFGECLPVTGIDQLDSLVRNATSTHYEYAYAVNAKPGATTLAGATPLIRGNLGQGRVIVSPWSTLGNPPEPFWRSTAFAKTVADAMEEK